MALNHIYSIFVVFLCAAMSSLYIPCYIVTHEKHLLYKSEWFFLFFLSELCRVLFAVLELSIASHVIDICVLVGSGALTICYCQIAYAQAGNPNSLPEKIFFVITGCVTFVLFYTGSQRYDITYVFLFLWACLKLYPVRNRDKRTHITFFVFSILCAFQFYHRMLYPVITGNSISMLQLSVISEICFYIPVLCGICDIFSVLHNRAAPPPKSENVPVQSQTFEQFISHICEKHSLSSRERTVFSLLAEGKTNTEISNQLYISEGTVKAHVHNIYRKMNISGRSELLALISRYVSLTK